MYHIIANLELMFGSLAEAQTYVTKPVQFQPRIPWTTMPKEDRTTPRICVAPTVKDCITAMKPTGIFRRCLNSNPDTKSYENDHEVYPIFVVKFPDSLPAIKPEKTQVPDIDLTHELWLLSPAAPEKIEIKWLDAYSVKIQETKSGCTFCSGVTFVENITGRNYPWLNQTGHPLDSSEQGAEPWPRKRTILSQLWHDPHFGGQLGYITPTQPFDGRVRFFPLDKSIPPYYSFPERIRRFSGLTDKNGRLLLDGSMVKFHGAIGDLIFANDLAWMFVPLNGDPPHAVNLDDVRNDNSVPCMTVLNPEQISIPKNF